jgi:TonB family protein
MASTSDFPPGPAVPAASPPAGEGENPVAHTLALLQPWIEFVPKQQRRLGIFIFLALLAHLALFFFIRIDTTRAELQRQARTHVTVENTTVQAGSSDAFWDRLTDPRLFLLPMTPLADLSPGAAALDLSAITPRLDTQALPPAAPAGVYEVAPATAPSVTEEVQEAMIPPRVPFSYGEAAPAVAAKTTLQWDAALAQRGPVGAPDLSSPVSDTDLSPTELRVAVDGGGTVQHVLLEESCQNPELDQQAILAARKTRFSSAQQPGLAWGRLTVFWHYAAQPREETAPTPASSSP